MKKTILFLILIGAATLQASAQCDTTAHYAKKYLQENFIPDGQSYRALIYDDQVAEFETTLFGNSTYRVVGFSGLEKEQLIFSLYDREGNLLFSNENHGNSPYWDFEMESTVNVRLEARLDQTKQSSGCVVLLVGFER
jgi:hypothetical protein